MLPEGAKYASNAIANSRIPSILDYSVAIPRDQLCPKYGQGFKGAPLITENPSMVKHKQDDRGDCLVKGRAEKGRSKGHGEI
jgi:hypothetical protein